MLPDVAKNGVRWDLLRGAMPVELTSLPLRAFGRGRFYRVTLTGGSEELAGQVASLILKDDWRWGEENP